jgi:hydrogenase maturation protease
MSERQETECDDRSSHSVFLILGLGNPLRRDDGVGPRVIAELKDRGLPEGVTALDGGTGGLDLLHIIEGWERVLIVDAADVTRGNGRHAPGQSAPGELAPGQFVRFTPDQARLTGTAERFSFHHAGLVEVLALARALERPLPPIVVFGVQPEDIGWGEGLSPGVEAGLPSLIDAVLEEVNHW